MFLELELNGFVLMSIQEFILLCNSHDGDYVDMNILEQANHLLHRCALGRFY